MSETKIEISISGENAAGVLERIRDDLPEDAVMTASGDAVPSAGDLIRSGFEASSGLHARMVEWYSSVDFSPATILAICAAIFVGAYIIERALDGAFLQRWIAIHPREERHQHRLVYALRWGTRQILRVFLFFAVARIGFMFSLPHDGEAAELALVALSTVMLVRVWYVILEMLAGSRDATRRPTALSDADALQIMRYAVGVIVFLGLTALVREFVVSVVDAGQSGALFAVATRLLDFLVMAGFFILIREPVGRLIAIGFATDPQEPGTMVRFVSRFWPAIYIVLLFLQIAAEAKGYLSGTLGEDATALKRSFGAFILAPFIFAGLGVWRDQLLSENGEETKNGRIQGIFSLLEGGLVVGTGIFIMYAWNIDPFATDLTGAKRILPGLVSAAIVTVVGISLWRTASALLDRGQTGSSDEEGGIPDGEGGAGGSRIETVLPVLRAVLAAFIGTVTVLLALSSLGVEIAPLLAGAGILGLAIGFGAQKVVEDVISGVLYLVEDAFRKGEYIETSQGKGVVEAIMLRSVRLRHHLGPVFTIPFSAMGTIQNHSRDWVTVKLKFEVGPDQDLEKVRKLIKKVGQQLLDDPELEGQFLAPLKSQGAVALVGSNYQIGVKFTSEPGKQFLIRRKALNAIQHAFHENGIEMAAPRVIVDSPEQAAAAAAKILSDSQNETGASKT